MNNSDATGFDITRFTAWFWVV